MTNNVEGIVKKDIHTRVSYAHTADTTRHKKKDKSKGK
jgi:hypothetical protein